MSAPVSGSPFDAASAAALRRRARSVRPDLTVEVVPEIASTNGELMRRVQAPGAVPTLLVAARQTAGRGRLGRSWASGDAGASLTFSLALPLAPTDWSGLSLAVGCAVVEGLADPALRLKWPNDVWRGDRKLGGILIETVAPAGPAPGAAEFHRPDVPGDRPGETAARARWAVIGIGLNVDAPPPPSDSSLAAIAPAWLREQGADANAADALLRILAPILVAVRDFESHGFAPFQARFEARDALRDRAVRLSDGRDGTAHGVDESGRLLVHTARGLALVAGAEVSVRPMDTGSR